MKIDLEEVISIVRNSDLEPEKAKEIIENLKQVEKELEEEKAANKKDKRKKNELIAVAVENGYEGVENSELYIIQVKEDFEHDKILDSVRAAASEFNQTKRGSKRPVKTFKEAFEFVKPKQYKVQNIVVKNKYPVIIVGTENKLW